MPPTTARATLRRLCRPRTLRSRRATRATSLRDSREPIPLTVSNVGGSPTSGSVTVIDELPAGLVPTTASGTGWTCNIAGQGVSCTRSDPLAPGQSYPAITLTVSVQRNAPASVTNTAVVFGGGEVNPSNNTAPDPTTITAGPNLTITKSHTGNFTQGQTGTYTLTVSNTGGAPTSRHRYRDRQPSCRTGVRLRPPAPAGRARPAARVSLVRAATLWPRERAIRRLRSRWRSRPMPLHR